MLDVSTQCPKCRPFLGGQRQVKSIVLRHLASEIAELRRRWNRQGQQSGLGQLQRVLVVRGVLIGGWTTGCEVLVAGGNRAAMRRIGSGVALAVDDVKSLAVGTDADRARIPAGRDQADDPQATRGQ